MCNCKPKRVIIGKPDETGYAVETCLNCKTSRKIPATIWAVSAALKLNYANLHYYDKPATHDRPAEYKPINPKIANKDLISNNQVFGEF